MEIYPDMQWVHLVVQTVETFITKLIFSQFRLKLLHADWKKMIFVSTFHFLQLVIKVCQRRFGNVSP